MRTADHGKRPGLFRNLKPLVLASASPRRKALLEALGLEFEVLPAEISEEISEGLGPEEVVISLALKKAREVAERCPGKAVLAADTLVVKGERVFGKPRDLEKARQILFELSGSWHEVLTGVAVLHGEASETFFSRTEVRFRELSDEEIEAYLATGEPLGKAGAYAIQGLASAFVAEVRGSVTGVIGLPLAETVEILMRLDIITPAV